MAIFHCSVKTISRRDGRSSTAASAYRASAKIEDLRTGETFDFRRKRGTIFDAVVAPDGERALAENELWNLAEKSEKRKDATVAREIVVALPYELPQQAQIDTVRRFARHICEQYGVAIQCNVHLPDRRGDKRNLHAHLLMTTRRFRDDGLHEKTRALDDRKTGPDEIKRIRKMWEDTCNAALAQAGRSERITADSLEKQGSDRTATQHEGPIVTQMRRRHRPSRVAARNSKIKQENAEMTNAANQPQQRNPAPHVAPWDMREQQYQIARAKREKERIARDEQAQRKREREALEEAGMITGPGRKHLPTLSWLRCEDQGHDIKLYKWPATGEPVFLDEGQRLAMCGRQTDAKVRAMISACKEKNWKEIEIGGNEEFKHTATVEAARAGIAITNKDPELQKRWQNERERIEREQNSRASAIQSPAGGGLIARPAAPAPDAEPADDTRNRRRSGMRIR